MEVHGSLASYPGISNVGKKGKHSIQLLGIGPALDLKMSFQKDDSKILRLLPAFFWECLETFIRAAASQKDRPA